MGHSWEDGGQGNEEEREQSGGDLEGGLERWVKGNMHPGEHSLGLWLNVLVVLCLALCVGDNTPVSLSDCWYKAR